MERVVCPDTERVVAVALVNAAEDADRTPTDAEEILVVAKVEVPLTPKTPDDRVSDDKVVTNAFVVVELPTTSDVRLASVATREEKNPVVLVLLVIVPLVEYSVVAVKAVEDAVVSTVCPDTVRVEAVDVARVVVPEIVALPEEVIVVKDGLGEMPMVEVPVKITLDPAMRYETGVLKKLDHCDVEAVSGMS